jgi:hypothetical protein
MRPARTAVAAAGEDKAHEHRAGEKYRALLGSVKRLSQKIAEGVEVRIEVAGR